MVSIVEQLKNRTFPFRNWLRPKTDKIVNDEPKFIIWLEAQCQTNTNIADHIKLRHVLFTAHENSWTERPYPVVILSFALS